MSVDVSLTKTKFARLKWEQLLADKYFVQTCFSKKWESLSAKDQLQDMHLCISLQPVPVDGITSGACGPDCA